MTAIWMAVKSYSRHRTRETTDRQTDKAHTQTHRDTESRAPLSFGEDSHRPPVILCHMAAVQRRKKKFSGGNYGKPKSQKGKSTKKGLQMR